MIVLWAIFNLVLAFMTIFGNDTAGVWLAWSIIIGWIISVLNALFKD